jgi:hypothetical protein
LTIIAFACARHTTLLLPVGRNPSLVMTALAAAAVEKMALPFSEERFEFTTSYIGRHLSLSVHCAIDVLAGLSTSGSQQSKYRGTRAREGLSRALHALVLALQDPDSIGALASPPLNGISHGGKPLFPEGNGIAENNLI